MRLTSIRRRRRRRRRWRQRPEIFRRRWSVATPVGLHPSYVATDHRRFLTTNPGGTPLIIRGQLFRQPRPALLLVTVPKVTSVLVAPDTKNDTTSQAYAVLVNVGAVPPAHMIEDDERPHVTVRLPVPSWQRISRSVWPAITLKPIWTVVLPSISNFCWLPWSQFTLMVEAQVEDASVVVM